MDAWARWKNLSSAMLSPLRHTKAYNHKDEVHSYWNLRARVLVHNRQKVLCQHHYQLVPLRFLQPRLQHSTKAAHQLKTIKKAAS